VDGGQVPRTSAVSRRSVFLNVPPYPDMQKKKVDSGRFLESVEAVKTSFPLSTISIALKALDSIGYAT
jgi:hypothetical protein